MIEHATFKINHRIIWRLLEVRVWDDLRFLVLLLWFGFSAIWTYEHWGSGNLSALLSFVSAGTSFVLIFAYCLFESNDSDYPEEYSDLPP